MESAYPGSNILVVTLTNVESKRIEAQSDEETKTEAMGVLRAMFGAHVPEASDILVPRWWNNRFQRGSYSFYPVHVDHHLLHRVKVFAYTTTDDNASSDDNHKSLKSTIINEIYVTNEKSCDLIVEGFLVQAPVGRIFFSGEHTSEKFNGYVHGGYYSGELNTCRRIMGTCTRWDESNVYIYLYRHGY